MPYLFLAVAILLLLIGGAPPAFAQSAAAALLSGADAPPPVAPAVVSRTSVGRTARFRWEYQPRSELFVVFTEGRNTFGPGYPFAETRGFVVKINRLFRM